MESNEGRNLNIALSHNSHDVDNLFGHRAKTIMKQNWIRTQMKNG